VEDIVKRSNMEKVPTCEEWTTAELFDYAVAMSLIDPEEEFDNWMHDRGDLLEIVSNDIENK